MNSAVHAPPVRASRRWVGRASKRQPTQPLPALSVFVAYGDVTAAREAMIRLDKLLNRPRRRYALQPMLWRFDQLDRPSWREMALRDALHAHALVLALGEAATLCPAAEAWLTSLAARQRGTPITVVALLGDDEAWTISLERTDVQAARLSSRRPVHPVHSATTFTASGLKNAVVRAA